MTRLVLKVPPPPQNDQALANNSNTETNNTLKAKNDRYLVIFKDQPVGIANSEAAQQAIAKIERVLSDLSIPG